MTKHWRHERQYSESPGGGCYLSSLTELVEKYCSEVVLRPVSQENYRTVMRVFQRDTGISNPRNVDFDVVLAWRKDLVQRASVHTWNTYRGDLTTIFNRGLRRGWVANNPFLDVGPLYGDRKIRTIPKSLVTEALVLLRSDRSPISPGWFWETAFLVLLFTGMRRRQLSALRWRDLDFGRETIRLATEGSKTRREWEIPMPPQCVEVLRTLRSRTLEKCAKLEDKHVFRIQLFTPMYKGENLTGQQITAAFRRLSESLNHRVTAHRLRHTMATELAQGDNPDLRSLQFLLGHTNLRTTLDYVQPNMDQLRRQVAKFRLDE